MMEVMGGLRRKWFNIKKGPNHRDSKNGSLKAVSFNLRQIKAATKNFDAANKIGEGGFGAVYKGILSDGTMIAVKKLSTGSRQGSREFINEIGMISTLEHPNLVQLYGACMEGTQLLLVYEYMENNSLFRALLGREENQIKLDWHTRCKICFGIAKGLAFLHDESTLKIVHRDIKATNILLDKNLTPKISDFGLARLNEGDKTHISTRIAGTIGYMAPEYAMHGYLTDKADVYSFGVVILETISGRNMNYRPEEDCFSLLHWANILLERKRILDIVDPRLGSDYNKEEARRIINVALACINSSPSSRPSMSTVVKMLQGRASVLDPVVDSNAFGDYRNPRSKRYTHPQIQKGNQSFEETNVTYPFSDQGSSNKDSKQKFTMNKVSSGENQTSMSSQSSISAPFEDYLLDYQI